MSSLNLEIYSMAAALREHRKLTQAQIDAAMGRGVRRPADERGVAGAR